MERIGEKERKDWEKIPSGPSLNMGGGGESVIQHEVRGFNNIPIQKTIMIRECFASELLELEKTF